MRKSKSSNKLAVARLGSTPIRRHNSFILHEKSGKNDTVHSSLERMYKEAEKSFEHGEYEDALVKFLSAAKTDPNNTSFMLGVKKSKTAIVNDLASSNDILQQLRNEIRQYPINKNLKDEIPMMVVDDEQTRPKEEEDISDFATVKSETMRAAVTKVQEKKTEPKYSLTINDGTCYKTITATAQEVKEYFKDRSYFKNKGHAQDWKKLRSQFNKQRAEQQATENYEKEAKLLEEKSNARHHCEEQINLIGRYYQNGKMTDVIRFSENFIKYLNKKQDKIIPKKWIYLATAFNYLARAFAEEGDFKKAKAFGEKLYRIAIISSNTELIAQSYILSGKIYVKFENYKEAAFVWEKLIPLINDDERKAWLYHEIGRCYFEMGKYDSSYKNGTESAHWAGNCSSSTWSCAANVLLGQIDMKRNKYEEALQKFLEAKKHAELCDDEQTMNYITSVEKVINLIINKNRNQPTDAQK